MSSVTGLCFFSSVGEAVRGPIGRTLEFKGTGSEDDNGDDGDQCFHFNLISESLLCSRDRCPRKA